MLEYEKLNINSKWAKDTIEGFDFEFEIENQWALSIVKESILELSPQESKVIEYLSSPAYDSDINDYLTNSRNAAEQLGMSSPAFRKYKSRAFKKLRDIIPEKLEKSGIILQKRMYDAIFDDYEWKEPSDDE